MTTLYGGARPDDFSDDDVLTAALFKQATGFWVADDVPSDGEGKDGDVVFVLKEEELGGGGSAELPGLGGWAEITDVSGSPKRYAYPEGDTDWVAFEWTQDGSVTTAPGGLVDALVVGAGGDRSGETQGGHVIRGALVVANATVKVGRVNQVANGGGHSALGQYSCNGGKNYDAHAWGASDGENGLVSNIQDGSTSIEYGAGGKKRTDNPGCATQNGTVIVRVPAAQAAGVDPGKWVTRSNYFAVVENGVVTETYTEHHYGNGTITPLPQTDLIPCDANVTEGYSYENGEFVAPVPEIPAAQQKILDKINELQQDLEELTK